MPDVRLEGRTHGPPTRARQLTSMKHSLDVCSRKQADVACCPGVNKRTVLEVTCGMTHAGDILEDRVVVCWNELKDRVVATCMCQLKMSRSLLKNVLW